MTNSRRGGLATAALVVLTLGTALLVHGDASAWLLAANAVVKAGVVGWVFLELDRAWPVWTALAFGTIGAIAFGAALILGTA